MPPTSLPTLPPLPVPLRKQIQLADCLAACAAMLIAFAGRAVDYRQLLDLLQIGPLGTLRRHILRLTRLGFQVTYHEATLPLLVAYLQAGRPVIVFVDTGELPYWSTATNHAVVVVGATEDHLLVNDPAFETAPLSIPVGNFELAWLNCDNACALIDVTA